MGGIGIGVGRGGLKFGGEGSWNVRGVESPKIEAREGRSAKRGWGEEWGVTS